MSAKNCDLSRRAIVDGLVSAPVTRIPATAQATLSASFASAMERQAAAWNTWITAEDDAALDAANGPAYRTLRNLAETPCASDAEFLAKIRRLLACHDSVNGEDADTTECPEILTAIRLRPG